jgi:hypothetical protein
MSPFRIPRSLVLASMCLVVAAAGLASAADEQGRKVEQLTGGRTRIVWEGWTHPAEGAEEAGIAGYDSADGKPRVLTKNAGAWHSPFFTPDGNAVIYNVGQFAGGSEGSKIVNWDGTGDRWLVKGEFGWAHCLWEDPATGVVWVYVSDANQRSWSVDKCAFTKLYRVRLDKPEVRELIYETNRGGLWICASPDGKRLWGSLADSQQQCMFDIATKNVMPVTPGCDPSHSPTEDRFFAFHFTHRHMLMYDWVGGQAANRREIPVNTMPGIEGRENVWHPRWSTHPRIFSIMGPEHGGHAQIYLGRFDEKYTGVEGWVQITNNGKNNNWSHAWVETPKGQAKPKPPTGGTETAPPTGDAKPAAGAAGWPADRKELVFAWENGDAIAAKPVAFDKTGKPLQSFSLKHAWRHLGPQHQLLLTGAEAEVTGAADFAAERIAAVGAMTLLAVVHPAAFKHKDAQRIVALMDGATPLVAITQASNRVAVAVDGTWAGGEAVEKSLPPVAGRRPVAVAVVLEKGRLTAFVDGKARFKQDLAGQLKQPAAPRIVVGDDTKRTKNDAAAVERVALYARALSAEEVAAESGAFAAAAAARQAVPRIELRAKLLRMDKLPTKATLPTYTQGMTAFEYEVEEVVKGKLPQKKIWVADWTMLEHAQTPVAERKLGEIYELTLVPFESQAQLKQEYVSDAERDDDAPFFYDLFQ